jgi:hypothetical protein
VTSDPARHQAVEMWGEAAPDAPAVDEYGAVWTYGDFAAACGVSRRCWGWAWSATPASPC